MEDPPLNPSQQVERIREILVGRQMNQVEDRLRSLESTVNSKGSEMGQQVVERVRSVQSSVLEETRDLRRQIQQESQLRNEQFRQLSEQIAASSHDVRHHDQELQGRLRKNLESISSAMAARIDARVREVLQHLQTELGQWKHQVDRDVQGVRDESVSRTELKSRLARMASAAMEDESSLDDGYLL